jgi:hypothetical protein
MKAVADSNLHLLSAPENTIPHIVFYKTKPIVVRLWGTIVVLLVSNFVCFVLLLLFQHHHSVRIVCGAALVLFGACLIIALCYVGYSDLHHTKVVDASEDGSVLPTGSNLMWIDFMLRHTTMYQAYTLGYRSYSYVYVYDLELSTVCGKFPGLNQNVKAEQLRNYLVDVSGEAGEDVVYDEGILTNTAIVLHQLAQVRSLDYKATTSTSGGRGGVLYK